MSPEQLQSLGVNPEIWYVPLIDTFKRYGISTTQRQAAFLGQCMHESSGFRRLEEDLDYSAEGLMRTWPSRFPNMDTAEKYANHPEKIANKVYAGKMGNTEEGDGWKFHGRGAIQLTGRDNYDRCSKALGVDFIAQPELLIEPRYAILSAGWIWNKLGLNELADAKEYGQMTRRINGGLNGFEDRIIRITEAKTALETY